MKGGGSVKGPILSDAQLEQTGPEAPSCELYRATAVRSPIMKEMIACARAFVCVCVFEKGSGH